MPVPPYPGTSGDDGAVTVTLSTGAAARLGQLRRRVLSDDGPPRFFVSEVDGAPRWVAGLLAALQAALLSLLVVVMPAVAAYVATSADPSNADVSWYRAVAVAAGLWALAHGVPLVAGGTLVTLVPLGLTTLALFTCYASARRSGWASWSAFGAGVAGYAAAVTVVALLATGSPVGAALGLLGGVVVGGTGLGAGLLARPEAPPLRDLTRPAWVRVPAHVRAGAAAGVLATAMLVLIAAVVTTVWAVAGRATIEDVVAGLGLDAVGGTVLAFAELAVVPNLVVWALAWLAGPGFVIGAGSSFTVTEVVPGPLPALPVLGALPQPGPAAPFAVWTPVALLAVGVLVGWWSHRRRPAGPWWHPVVAGLVAGLTSALAVGVLVALASGSVGPGRMSQVGASALLVGAVVGAGVAVGDLLVALPADAEVRAAVRRAVGGLRGTDGRSVPARTVPADAPADATPDPVTD